eukprot:TRINITY_DN15689_c0_g1_i1.p1 TRINITY_DN15689_c0_g1~~TRINITY_DN15689_c0_g1_i1.p1  ORF type:complete len:642 (+),score=275.92 TRINITY_DN15689_c0_g1_i1:107-1927(+)
MEGETKRRGIEDTASELESRVEGLVMQVQLYKEKDKESTEKLKAVTKQNEDYDLMQARIESLDMKSKHDEAKIAELEDRMKVLNKENATLRAATSGSKEVQPNLNLDGCSVEQLREAVNEREKLLREAKNAAEEAHMRVENLTKSHEAFMEQTRNETEAEVTRRVQAIKEEHAAQKLEWQQDRTAMVETHVRQLTELQTEYDELKEGLEKSQAWTAKDKEVRRLKEEIQKISDEYNEQADRLADFKKYQIECTQKDELIANLRDQILESEVDMAETRTLCMQALKQASKHEGRSSVPTDGSSAAYLKGSVSSAASSASVTPPPSPKEKGDLFDLALTGRAKSKREIEIEKQLTRYKSKVRAEEAARQRNMDEVESYRADYVNALITEVETLRKTCSDRSSLSPSTDVVRLRGEFQRERESWEMEKMELERKVEELSKGRGNGAQEPAQGSEGVQAALTDMQLEKELLERELAELREGHEEKERALMKRVELMKQQIQESEEVGDRLRRKCGDLEAQSGVWVQSSQKLREAEIQITKLTAELHIVRSSSAATPPSFLTNLGGGVSPISLSPPPEEYMSTKEALAAERKARLETVRQQINAIRESTPQ